MKNKLSVNLFFLIFLIFAVTTVFTDYITYIFNINYFVELILGFLLTGCIFLLIKKKIEITCDFEKKDLFFLIFLLFIAVFTIVFPDKMYDSMNYHIYNQIHPLSNKITANFFPSSYIQSYSYAYPDRLFYIFRYILGYRLGTVLNYFILLIAYYQIKYIIKKSFNIESFAKNIIAAFAVLSLSIIDIMDTYYIDLISMVFLIELFIQVVYKIKLSDNKKDNFLNIGYIALLSGLSFATKISNLFFVILLAVIFFLINRKQLKNLKLLNIIEFLMIFLIPVALYIVYTYLQTGNPVFPFYNTIFKSQYYVDSNWMDTRFGPSNLKQLLLWPVYAMTNSCKTVDTCFFEPIWAFGYISCYIFMFFEAIKFSQHKKIDKSKLIFSFITISFNLVWAKFALGYVRYGFVALILSNISFYCLLYEMINNKKYILTGILSLCLLYNFGYFYNLYTNVNGFWSFNNYFAYGKDSYKYNLNKLLTKNDETIKFPKNSAWGVVNSNSAFMSLLNENIPMIYLRDNGLSKTKELQTNLINKIDHLYIVSDYLEFESFINALNETNYKIIGVYDTYKPSFVNYNNYLYVFELRKEDETNNNNFIETSEYEVDASSTSSVSLLYGLAGSMHNIFMENYEIVISDGEKIISREKITKNNHDLYKFDYKIKSSNSNDKIKIYVIDQSGNKIEWVKLLFLNIEGEY